MPPAGIFERLWTMRPRLILTLLLGCALASAAVGVWNGSHRSQDFQYSGERILLEHVDPWADFLAGDPLHALTMTQIPNYLPILYVLLVPYGLLSLAAARVAWALTNLLLAVASGLWVGRFYGMRAEALPAIISLLLMASPTRNTLGNGQQALLVLFFWSLMVKLAGRTQGKMIGGQAGLLGASYFKFTFGPPLLLFVLFRWGVRAALLTAVPALVALVLVWLWLTGGHDSHRLLSLALEPLTVATHGFTPDRGDPNLMNVAELALGRLTETMRNGVELALALAVCVPVSWFAFVRRRAGSLQWHMALLATMSYGLFKHHTYDAVVLLFPLCYGLSRWRQAGGRWIVGCMAYLFFGERILKAMHLYRWWFCVPDLLVLLSILALTYRLGSSATQMQPVVAASAA